MSRQKGFWDNLFNKTPPRERFSIDELRHLNDVLNRNTIVSDSNRELVVETLRSVAELMIWGDQHDPRFFEFFLENSVISHFSQMLTQKTNRKGNVAKQVLQTLSILIQNIRSETALYYMFSNNYINEICQLRFDFEDDEVLGYYINLLKTISLKLTPETVQFFFHDDGVNSSFPLYTEAVKFINHRDGMVRAAVRTLTLSIYNIQDQAVQRFVVSKPASNYFTELAIYLAEQCQALNRMLDTLELGTAFMVSKVDSCLAEVEDLLSYCNDILCTGTKTLADLLLENLWESFVAPILFWPLLQTPEPNEADGLLRHSSSMVSASSFDLNVGPSWGDEDLPPGRVSKLCALYIFERLMHVVQHTLFVNLLILVLVTGSLDASLWASSTQWTEIGSVDLDKLHLMHVRKPDSWDGKEVVAVESKTWHVPLRISENYYTALNHKPEVFRDAFFASITNGDCQLAAAAVRVLVALVLNRSADTEILDSVGLLPYRRKKNKELIEALTAPISPRGETADSTPASPRSVAEEDQSIPAATESMHKGFEKTGNKQETDDTSAERIASNHQASTCNGQAPSVSTNGPTRASTRKRSNPLPRPQPLKGRYEDTFIVDSLCSLLVMPGFPVGALWSTCWLLLQLVPSSKTGVLLTGLQAEFLLTALRTSWRVLQDELACMWADALVVLIHTQWAKIRQQLQSPSNQSTTAAVQAWMQASQWKELLRLSSMGRQRGALNMASANNSGSGAGVSAQAAKQTVDAVQRFLGVFQVKQALEEGSIAATPPLTTVTEANFQDHEIKEGTEVDLLSRLNCTVAFARGQERAVYFAIKGLPRRQAEDFDALEGFTVGSPPPPEAVASSVPVVVVADPGTKVNTGQVLSVAPLLGADASIDQVHGRWLHVHVRPPVRGLLKVLKTSHLGNMQQNIGRQLVDGHWVLAFPTPERAWYAKQLIDQHTARLRAFYCDVLSPLGDFEFTSSAAAQRT